MSTFGRIVLDGIEPVSGYVLPPMTITNLSDVLPASWKVPGYGGGAFSRIKTPSNFAHHFISEFRKFVSRASVMPVLGAHIGHVFGVRAKKQVRGINADFHIAVMTDMLSASDRSIGYFPRDSMSSLASSVPQKTTIANLHWYASP